MSWRRRRPDEARGSDGGGLGEGERVRGKGRDTACASHARAVAPAHSPQLGEGALWASPRPRRLRKLILWACGVGGMGRRWGRRHCETARERVRSHRGLRRPALTHPMPSTLVAFVHVVLIVFVCSCVCPVAPVVCAKEAATLERAGLSPSVPLCSHGQTRPSCGSYALPTLIRAATVGVWGKGNV